MDDSASESCFGTVTIIGASMEQRDGVSVAQAVKCHAVKQGSKQFFFLLGGDGDANLESMEHPAKMLENNTKSQINKERKKRNKHLLHHPATRI